MKTTLCAFCLKSGILCPSCKAKIESGEITQIYLETANTLMSLEKTYSSLQKVSLYNAVEAERVLAIVVERGDVATLLSYGGKIIRDLGRKMGKKVRVLEKGADSRKFLEDLFSPLSIVTINTIWLPDGTIDTRVILRGGLRTPPLRNLDALRKIVEQLRGMTIRVEFAR